MLDTFIIVEIKRRDRGAGREERPALELPVPPLPVEPARPDASGEDPKPSGGVVIIDYTT